MDNDSTVFVLRRLWDDARGGYVAEGGVYPSDPEMDGFCIPSNREKILCPERFHKANGEKFWLGEFQPNRFECFECRSLFVGGDLPRDQWYSVDEI